MHQISLYGKKIMQKTTFSHNFGFFGDSATPLISYIRQDYYL